LELAQLKPAFFYGIFYGIKKANPKTPLFLDWRFQKISGGTT
jgi:hypothetical protein